LSDPASPLVIVSPHLDDAVLSCGGRIARAVARGRRVVVLTAFTRDDPPDPPSPLATDLHRWWSLAPGEVMRRRRREDLEACARLGAEPVHLDFPDALYRLDAAGRPLYPTLERLFGELDPADAPLVEQLVEQLVRRIGEEDPAAELLAPLGVGHHVDHQLVRQAAERACPGAAFYEEFPYTEWKRRAVPRALGRPADWRSDALELSADELEARLGAIAAYASQVPAMFRNPGRLRRQLRRALRRSGGERLWRRVRPQNPLSSAAPAATLAPR
jgi:LmbE family N-acetylglucosaminyl deacetylase